MSKEKERYRAGKGVRVQKPAVSRSTGHFIGSCELRGGNILFCLLLICMLFSFWGCGGGGGKERGGPSTVSGFIAGDVKEGVTVTVSGDTDLETTTRADGFYSFTLPSGSYTLTASLENYLPIPRSRDIVVIGRNSSNNNFHLVKDLGRSGHWAKAVEGGISSSPAVALDGTIYVGSDDSFVYAFQPDGNLKWKYPTGGPVQSSPAIDQRGNIRIGSSDHRLYAFDPDGKLQWVFETGGAVRSSPAIDDLGRIYAGSDDNYLYALSSTGELRWSYKTGGEVQSSPAVDANGIVYVGSNDKNLYALSADGNLMWKFPARGAIKAPPVIGTDNTIYIGSCDHTFYAVTPQGGKKWSVATGGEIRSSCALGDDDTLYFGCDDHCLYALNADGTRRWTYQAGAAIGSSPAIDQENIIYFGCDDGTLYALNGQGTVCGAFRTGGGIYSSPCLTTCLDKEGEARGRIYVGSNDRNLYSIANQGKGAINSLWPMFLKGSKHQGAMSLNLLCSISGRINGILPGGVVVSLVKMDTGLAVATATTSSDGTFAFNNIQSGIYLISPQKTGYCFTPRTLEITTSSPRNEGNNFILSLAFLLSGKVSGVIQKGVTVEVRTQTGTGGSQSQVVDTAVTDDNGRFSFYLPAGNYILTPSLAPGYAFSPGTLPVSLTQDTAVIFSSLLKICTISGSVAGAVQAGVVLYLDGNDIEGTMIRGMTNTRANGSFEFTVHKGSYTITPFLGGYSFSPASRQVVIQNASSYGGNDFTAYAQSDSHILSGTVSGDIREGVTLTLSGDSSATASSDSQGNFSFQLPCGHYFLKASKAGYTFSPDQREITIQGSDSLHNDFASARLPYSISGRITGEVQKDVTVTLSSQGTKIAETLTDAQGNFSFTASGGSYTLTPAKAGCKFEPKSLEITLQGTNSSGLQFTSMKLAGVQQWAARTGGSIYSSPALGSDGTIYAGTYDDGQLYAIAADGSIKWKFATQRHIFASPVVDPKNGTIYVCCTDACVYAITPQGGEKWKKSLSDAIIATAAVGPDTTLYVGCNDGCLYALNSDSGQQKWSRQLEGPIASPAVGTDGTIYLGSGQLDWLTIDKSKGSLYALNPANGQNKWKKSICLFSRPAIGADGIIYVVSNRGSVYALDTRAAGEAAVKWEYRTGGTSLSSPTIGPNGTIYVGCDDNKLYALNPDGSLRWSAATGNKIRSSAAVGADGTVYIGSNDYYLYAFDSTSGELKWRFSTPGGSITAMPLIGKDGTIYVGSQNGLVYAIRGQ